MSPSAGIAISETPACTTEMPSIWLGQEYIPSPISISQERPVKRPWGEPEEVMLVILAWLSLAAWDFLYLL